MGFTSLKQVYNYSSKVTSKKDNEINKKKAELEKLKMKRSSLEDDGDRLTMLEELQFKVLKKPDVPLSIEDL